eukprot:TRINITY_DN10217_c0_g1_i3.p1 TRINITY_DN10217_c0_g1~~TRINITY_DN10217_c0_g1_i3.p1  ORF type:complete len:273 (-),score=70.45 TRINITY_DN10217_c0_g1_i3:62-790(-)
MCIRDRYKASMFMAGQDDNMRSEYLLSKGRMQRRNPSTHNAGIKTNARVNQDAESGDENVNSSSFLHVVGLKMKENQKKTVPPAPHRDSSATRNLRFTTQGDEFSIAVSPNSKMLQTEESKKTTLFSNTNFNQGDLSSRLKDPVIEEADKLRVSVNYVLKRRDPNPTSITDTRGGQSIETRQGSFKGAKESTTNVFDREQRIKNLSKFNNPPINMNSNGGYSSTMMKNYYLPTATKLSLIHI